MVRRPCPVCHPSGLSLWFFGTCLGLRGTPPTYELRCPASGCALHLSLCLGWAPWVIPCYFFSWLSLLERGCGVLRFRHEFCGEDSGPSLAPRFAGFTVPARPTRDNRNGRLLYPMRVVRCYLVRFGCASSAMRAVPFCR